MSAILARKTLTQANKQKQSEFSEFTSIRGTDSSKTFYINIDNVL